MNTLEDRLRAAAQAAAGTVADGSAPPLRLLQPGAPAGLPGWHRRHRWTVPLAAAAAVIALIAGSVFAARAVVPGARSPAPSAPLPQLADGLPAYFLESPVSYQVIASAERDALSSRGSYIRALLRKDETLRIVATATGKVAATIKVPGYVTAIAASRGAFFAAVLLNGVTRFYQISLDDSRIATTVTELPIPADTAPVAYMAVSPDAGELAYSTLVMHGKAGGAQDLVVASTAEGSEREWTTPARDSQGYMTSMAWLADGRTLAFNWTGSPEAPAAVSLRLLDTAAPGSDLLAGRAVLPSVYAARAFSYDTTLSPNGQVVVGVANGSAAPGDSVLAFSTSTGEKTVLYQASTSGDHETGCYSPLVWVSNAGSEVLATCFREVKPTPPAVTAYVTDVVLITHGHATVLPWLNATAAGVTAFP